jgi:hypothetical protein
MSATTAPLVVDHLSADISALFELLDDGPPFGRMPTFGLETTTAPGPSSTPFSVPLRTR